MMKPQNFAETVVWYAITGTLVLYFMGAQFLVGPAIAWVLAAYLLKKRWEQTDETPDAEKIHIPVVNWIWLGSMLVIGFALIMGHFDFDYGLTKTIKSFINFFLRTWALLALFPLAGCLKIRPQIIYRAVCILCLQCLVFAIAAYAIHLAGLPSPRYVSTLLAAIGGNDPRYYAVSFFTLEGGTDFRLLLFAPWAPALAFAGNIFFCLASQERQLTWRWLGMVSSALLIVGSASRLGLLCLVILPFLSFVLSHLSRPAMQISAGVASVLGGIWGYQIIQAMQDFRTFFDSQRASSSRVRGALARMAIYHWRDAPIWGHGVKAPQGPEVVQFMPLGSHQTWLGLLYVHGAVGFVALLIPILVSLVDLLIKAQSNRVAQTGLSILLILMLFSMGENLETLAYLYWPGLVMMGIAFNQQVSTAPQNHQGALSPVSTFYCFKPR